MPIPVESLTPVDGFRTYLSLFQRHQTLLTMHEEVDGQVVGRTVADREVWAYRVGDTDATTADGFPEGAVLVNGGIHAREWQTPEAVTGLMEALVAGKTDGGFGQYLVENLTTVLLPVHNVDGFLQTQRFPDRATADREEPRDGRMRRKNMRNPQTGGAVDEALATVADNFWGVDLNRNSANGFGQGGGSSSSLTSLIYRGAAATTEPEILASAGRGCAGSGGTAALLQRHAFLWRRSISHRPPATGGGISSLPGWQTGCAPLRCAAMASIRIRRARRASARLRTTSPLPTSFRAGPWSWSPPMADRITQAA